MTATSRPVRTAARRGVAACASVLLAAVLAHAEEAVPAKPAAPAAAPAAVPADKAPAETAPPAPAKKAPAPAKKSAAPAKPGTSAPTPAKAETPAAAAAPATAPAKAEATAPAKPAAAASAPAVSPPPATAPAPVVAPAPVAPAAGTAPAPAAPAPAAEAPAKPPQAPKPGSAKSAKTAKTVAVPPAAAPAPPPANVLPASSAEAEAVWHAYEKRWSETADYAAGFRQIIEVPDIGSKVESAGRFFFAKPGLVRWEYNEGPPQTVVGDGTWIWLYQPDLQQVYKIAYAKAFGRGGLVELLAGREGVSERYNVSLERPDAATVRIHLHAKAEGGGDLEVTLAADTFDLRAVKVRDSAGSTTQMTFTEPLRNKGVDRARFTFTPPPAVDIISDNEAGF